jgi:adenine deaminase
MKKITGKLVDLFSRKIFNAELFIENGRISNIKKVNTEFENFIVPGLVDSHVHIESSMLIPYQFAKLAVQNGTVAIVADPHEIANVLGKKGVEFMINNSKETPLKTFFGIPSCVPATLFETSGAVLDHNDIDELLTKQEVKILGEMMNFPGVINEDETVIKKLNVAKKHNAQIDGHIPGISGDNLKKYIDSGISTDHECFTIEEASEKIKLGMKILIREGSAAKNFDELYPLISKHNKMVMLCTDDSHPDDLINYGHINKIIKKGIKYGLDIFDLLSAACINPVEHYNLPVGLLRVNDPADFIIVDDINNFNILETYIDGEIVYSNNRVFFNNSSSKPVNNFNANKISVEDLKVKPKSNKIKVIEIIDKELITNSFIIKPKVVSNNIISDIEKDILKIVVYNRYQKNSKPSIGFIHGIGLKSGAIATTVAHDSHNIIATGCSDEEIAAAINEIVEKQGGLTFVHGKDYYTLELEYAGLMTNKDPMIVADLYEKMNKVIKQNGLKLTAPYMTISFMALLVIPHLKIGDKGLFDVDRFEFTQLFV